MIFPIVDAREYHETEILLTLCSLEHHLTNDNSMYYILLVEIQQGTEALRLNFGAQVSSDKMAIRGLVIATVDIRNHQKAIHTTFKISKLEDTRF